MDEEPASKRQKRSPLEDFVPSNENTEEKKTPEVIEDILSSNQQNFEDVAITSQKFAIISSFNQEKKNRIFEKIEEMNDLLTLETTHSISNADKQQQKVIPLDSLLWSNLLTDLCKYKEKVESTFIFCDFLIVSYQFIHAKV
jgi:hypothetical protein